MSSDSSPPAPLSYPDSAPDPAVVDTLHGVSVPDPYRWLEADYQSEPVKAWIASQVAVTSSYLESIPGRDALRKRLFAAWNHPRYSAPSSRKTEAPAAPRRRIFWYMNTGLQNHSPLFVQEGVDAEAAAKAEPRVLVDPNAFSEDGTTAMAGTALDHAGDKLAYSVSEGGSDWNTWRVRDVATGEDIPGDGPVKWVKFSGAAWLKNGDGYFYGRYDAPKEEDGEALQGVNEFQKLFFHKVGTPQSADRLVLEFPEEAKWGSGASITDDGKYLLVSVWRDTSGQSRELFKPIPQDGMGGVDDEFLAAPFTVLVDEFEAKYTFIDNEGPRFWFLTDLDAPRGKVIEVDVSAPGFPRKDVIAQSASDPMESVSVLNNRFYVQYLRDARAHVERFELDGSAPHTVELPGIGSIGGGFYGEKTDTDTYFTFTSFVSPSTVYHYDCEKDEYKVFKRPEIEGADLDAFESKQVFIESKDGTKVPMFVTHKKGLAMDGSNPTYLYGYGGFKISITPYFSVANLIWMEMGGVLAIPNIRGGDEYGEEWHQGGMKSKKQNVFDDFIAAAEHLIASNVTRSSKLIIGGGSNGGLLVGACMTQRPDLFGAALPNVGVMDMLRFHKFTIGWAWCSEYGSADNADDFPVLLAYSPLHNVKPGTKYPATLVFTADHDDRVVPAHSFKFAAALQAADGSRGTIPQLIRIDCKAGHGAGKPTSMKIEEIVDQWSFAMHATGSRIEFAPAVTASTRPSAM